MTGKRKRRTREEMRIDAIADSAPRVRRDTANAVARRLAALETDKLDKLSDSDGHADRLSESDRAKRVVQKDNLSVAALPIEARVQPKRHRPREAGKHASARVANGLTHKQDSFAWHVAKGDSLADAFRAAYDSQTMAVNSVYSQASLLLSNLAVAERVKEYRKAMRKEVEHDPLRIRSHVIQTLLRESEEAEQASARIRAAELLGKLDTVSMFKDTIERHDSSGEDAATLARILTERLRNALAQHAEPVMLDITPDKPE